MNGSWGASRAVAWPLLLLTATACGTPSAVAGPRDEPAKTLAVLDEEYAASEKDLLRRCNLEGSEDLAAIIAAWNVKPAAGQQLAFSIPPTLETPACVDTDAEKAVWDDFLAARRARAAGVYEHAIDASRAHARQPTRSDLADPSFVPPVIAQSSCEAVRLLFLTLRDDPLHEKARTAGGWVRRDDRWEWPEAARHLDRGDEYDADYGWMAKSKLTRYRAGERYLRGQWVKASDDDATLRDVKNGRQFASDHWEIVTTAPPQVTGELAHELEAARLVWIQVFGGFASEPADLEKRINGRGRVTPQTPHSAILCGSRRQYIAELRAIEPNIDIADGLYWQPTATIWCFADPAMPLHATIRHEAFHQLFAESRPEFVKLKADPGRRSGFWAIEAAALYAESIKATSFGWTIGGSEAGRVPAARGLLANDTFHVPLGDLVALSRDDFQSHDRVVDLYDQCGGLADFFMNANNGRYREAFLKYLTRVYSGTADPDTLSRLCRRSYPELDAEYKAFMQAR